MRKGWLALLLTAPLAAQFTVQWEHEYAKAVARAKAEKKLIFMDLWAEWCGPCRMLQRDVFPSSEAQVALSRYVPLSEVVQKKDRTPVPEGTSLADKFKLEAFPTLIILDADGKEVKRETGAFRTGAELAAWLK